MQPYISRINWENFYAFEEPSITTRIKKVEKKKLKSVKQELKWKLVEA